MGFQILNTYSCSGETFAYRRYCECRCDCGRLFYAIANNVSSGSTKSCGCLRNKRLKTRSRRYAEPYSQRSHPLHKLYARWVSMHSRCVDTKKNNFKYYGGRGIKVCERWNDFENFLADMGEPPPGLTLDRIENDGNYEPNNCRWATRKEQQANTRPRPEKKAPHSAETREKMRVSATAAWEKRKTPISG